MQMRFQYSGCVSTPAHSTPGETTFTGKGRTFQFCKFTLYKSTHEKTSSVIYYFCKKKKWKWEKNIMPYHRSSVIFHANPSVLYMYIMCIGMNYIFNVSLWIIISRQCKLKQADCYYEQVCVWNIFCLFFVFFVSKYWVVTKDKRSNPQDEEITSRLKIKWFITKIKNFGLSMASGDETFDI